MIRFHYDILGLKPDCTLAEIKEAHLDLTMLMQHQKVLPEIQTHLFRSYLDESYQILSDPEWRVHYQKTFDGLQKKSEELKGENQKLKELLQKERKEKETLHNQVFQLKDYLNHLSPDQEHVQQLLLTIEQLKIQIHSQSKGLIKNIITWILWAVLAFILLKGLSLLVALF